MAYSGLAPDPPTPPNPMQTAAAQTGTNVSTAIANSYLGNVNQQTPQGNLTYTAGNPFTYTDPTTQQTFSIPRWTATQTLTPQGQQTFDNSQAAQLNLSDMAKQQSGALGDLLGAPFDPSRGNFNVAGYLAANPDVKQYALDRGWDPNEFAANHWQQWGYNEGRSSGGTAPPPMANLNLFDAAGMPVSSFADQPAVQSDYNFDPIAYLQTYPDVAAAARASGQDPQAFAAQHWREFGQTEGRAANSRPSIQYGYGSGGDIQRDYGTGHDVMYGFDQYQDPNWDITRSYGPQDNFSADRARVEDALMQRMNPQLQVEQDRLRQQLADQGIRYGSPAYTQAMDVYNRQANDARYGAIERGGVEQQRLTEMARAQATFENAAQQQGFTQAQARAAFYNMAQQQGMEQSRQRGAFANTAQAQAEQQAMQRGAFSNQAQQQAEGQAAARGAFFNQAQQQQYEQAQARAGFYNAAQQQALARQNAIFNAQNQQRNQALQEGYQQRTQPINEIAALMSGSQVSQPNFVNAPRNQIPTTDVAGLINQGFSQQNDIYKTGLSSWNDLMGGILGAGGKLGGSAILASDRRVKDNIIRMGDVFSAKGDKLPIYQYSYKDDPEDRRHVGPMAQDVEDIDPSAVKEIDEVKHIDVARLGSIFGMRRAA